MQAYKYNQKEIINDTFFAVIFKWKGDRSLFFLASLKKLLIVFSDHVFL